ncbi:MAG: tRNA-dihydrouridine synthase, partial [Patescibacteria group bacterium]
KWLADRGAPMIDINMGCPDRAVEKSGCGAALIKNPKLARELIRSAGSVGLPVSVKTRIGYNSENMDEWLTAVLSEKPAALTVHLRTRKEMSKVPAHWELMSRAVEIRDRVSPETRILGNGDVKDITDAREKIESTGADGAMLGRAIFGNPWVFAGRVSEDISEQEKLTALLELARNYEALRPQKSFHLLKKHVKAFVVGFEGSAQLRAELMEAPDFESFINILTRVL